MKVYKLGIDIGGVLSKHVDFLRTLINFFSDREGAGIEIHILTDMPWSKARELLALNNVRVPEARIHSCDYATHGDGCKAEVAREIGLDALMDDHMGYLAMAGAPMLRLFVMPDPSQPYYDPAWKTSILDPPEWGRQTYKAP